MYIYIYIYIYIFSIITFLNIHIYKIFNYERLCLKLTAYILYLISYILYLISYILYLISYNYICKSVLPVPLFIFRLNLYCNLDYKQYIVFIMSIVSRKSLKMINGRRNTNEQSFIDIIFRFLNILQTMPVAELS